MKRKKSFDAKYYRNLVESIHDAQKDLTSSSTRISNRLVMRVIKYLAACAPLNDAEKSEMKLLLTHPKKGARVMAAVYLTSIGEQDGWLPLVEAAAPVYMPEEEDDEEGWKDYWATHSARQYLGNRYEEKLRQHNWQPTLEEMEDKWAQEPRPKLRITNPPK
jgi:hypothetical protein